MFAAPPSPTLHPAAARQSLSAAQTLHQHAAAHRPHCESAQGTAAAPAGVYPPRHQTSSQSGRRSQPKGGQKAAHVAEQAYVVPECFGRVVDDDCLLEVAPEHAQVLEVVALHERARVAKETMPERTVSKGALVAKERTL